MSKITGRVSVVLLAAIGTLATNGFGAEVQKTEPFLGVTHYQIVQTVDDARPPVLPRPVVIHLLEIDTRASGIRFEMSPGNGDAPGEITRGTTRAFVDDIGAQIGINVGFYDTRANYGGLHTDLVHLAASKGDVYSPANAQEWVFDIARDGTPRIARADGKDATTADGKPVFNAAGGNQPMLHNGEIVAPPDNYTKALNPHTAVGVSKDQSKVYFMVVDGRQSGYSEGMRTDEMAAVLRDYGAWNAVNFDGGGSTTLVMDDTDNAQADARVVNSPSDGSSPAKAGNERVVANSLAVFATPRAGYVPLPPIARPKMEDGLELVKVKTVIDDFEADAGHFGAAVTASGSTRGVSDTSKSSIDKSIFKEGVSSLKVQIVPDESGGETLLRLISGDATPKQNKIGDKAMGNDGFVGVWLRREPSDAKLTVALVVDEGTPSAVSTERSVERDVIADGNWHLYQWGLNEDAKWFNYNGGNGRIDGPNVFIDSLVFRGEKPFAGAVWLDGVTFSPDEMLK